MRSSTPAKEVPLVHPVQVAKFATGDPLDAHDHALAVLELGGLSLDVH